ncbi:EcsC family protein [Terrisporobacter vanillatitrophus]|uniref:EcsC family protein n=1 Tax=Terrisporobacter vanillatitrophus TaxID=3058402 RepID=UPI003367C886
MDDYIIDAKVQHKLWKREMEKKVSLINKIASNTQKKFNSMLPRKYHEILTNSVKTMVKTVLFGYKYITKEPFKNLSIEEREKIAKNKINFYKKTAMAEGFATGAGGFILGMTDFPLLLSIKVKLLYDIATVYGFDVRDYKERLYILNIIQLAFSSQSHSKSVFNKMENWDEYSDHLPGNIDDFDWESFQQEYRDYLDLAKLLQLMPGIGAAVGFYVNGKLLDKLGDVAINSYRMRLEEFK